MMSYFPCAFAAALFALLGTAPTAHATSAAAAGAWGPSSISCKNIWHPADCTSNLNCRWRQSKQKCIEICQGRPTKEHCAKRDDVCEWIASNNDSAARVSNSNDGGEAEAETGEGEGEGGTCSRIPESRANRGSIVEVHSLLVNEDNLMQFQDVDHSVCHSVNETTTISIAPMWAGYLHVEVDWTGEDDITQHGMNVAEFSSTDLTHVYKEAGTYTITASAQVRRLNADRTAWESISQEFTTQVTIRDDCNAFQGIVSATCEPIEFTGGNGGSYMTRLCFVPAVTQTVTYSVDWGQGTNIPLTKTFHKDKEFCRSRLYGEVGQYDLIVTSGASESKETLLNKEVYVMSSSCVIGDHTLNTSNRADHRGDYIYESVGNVQNTAQAIKQMDMSTSSARGWPSYSALSFGTSITVATIVALLL